MNTISNIIFDKQCYITTRNKLYIGYSKDNNCFCLNDSYLLYNDNDYG